jgi:hypothetical protein
MVGLAMVCEQEFFDANREGFRDRRDDGIAEASDAVHPMGNPMSHSTHAGFNSPPSATTGSLKGVPVGQCATA